MRLWVRANASESFCTGPLGRGAFKQAQIDAVQPQAEFIVHAQLDAQFL